MSKNNPNLIKKIQTYAKQLGLEIALVQPDLKKHNQDLKTWLKKGYHGTMTYMQKHQDLRANPQKLHSQTKTILIVRLNYYNPSFKNAWQIIADSDKAYISRYALGRDYHKVLKNKLKILAKKLQLAGIRIFTDSAPVLEKPIAQQAGLGWIGKHTNLINSKEGSYFFLGEIYSQLDIKIKVAQKQSHCGSCTKCIDICPTKAIIAPYQLDARKCISYLTIEHQGIIDPIYHQAIGNRIFGCDDCQLVCPWNRFARFTDETDFKLRHNLDKIDLLHLWAWDEKIYLEKTAGMALRRTGYNNWMRNIAIAMGNATKNKSKMIEALQSRYDQMNDTVQIHINWAIKNLKNKD